ncbi:universal stress protein [Chloroflexota bacterium]
MRRFKNVLVVIDRNTRNEALIERAILLGKRNRAQLTVVSVSEKAPEEITLPSNIQTTEEGVSGIEIIETLPDGKPGILPEKSTAIPKSTEEPQKEEFLERWRSDSLLKTFEIQDEIDMANEFEIGRIAEKLRENGIQVKSKRLFGTAFIEIIREVIRNNYDLVMIAAEGKSKFRERIIGRTTMHLMRKCPCPVWVLKPSQPKQYQRIMAAVDPTPFDQKRSDINIKIMDLATSLAKRDQSELMILHTWQLPIEDHINSGRVHVPTNTVDEWNWNVKEERKRSLRSLLDNFDFQKIKYQVYLLKGEAARLIPEFANSSEVELIVMGTVARTGVAGFLMGNIAEKVLGRVNCSVLTVKPDGFITPVKLSV